MLQQFRKNYIQVLKMKLRFFKVLLVLCASLIFVNCDKNNSISSVSEDFKEPYQLAEAHNILLWNSNAVTTITTANLDDRVRFFSYSKSKGNFTFTKCRELRLNDTKSLQQGNVKKGKIIKLLIHGFQSNCTLHPFPQDIIEAYLKTYGKSYNVMCVDWGPIAAPLGELSSLLYTRTVRNMYQVGEKVARFIAFLCDEKFIDDAKQIHIIGYSLGAHVAGIAGNLMQKTFNSRIGRITGLDPAGPSFDNNFQSPEYKLDNSDAKFVDIIHTNMGHLGIRAKLGHVDFYPNGGERQPRCYKDNNILRSITESIFGRCSHRSSSVYYAQSIQTKKLIACQCQSWDKYKNNLEMGNKCSRKRIAVLGEHCSPSTRGNFCLEI